ncbi:MAG: hypothetical protein KatS3mg059_1719 [Thermomicrobiales bacterium]|nr:MAG: hypothetical protein KatS3mg059_1719 [Thermomicrobiales bacterium]
MACSLDVWLAPVPGPEIEPANLVAERHSAAYVQTVQTFLRAQTGCFVDFPDGPSPALDVVPGSASPSSPPHRKHTQRFRRMACDSRFLNPHLARGAFLRDRLACTARSPAPVRPLTSLPSYGYSGSIRGPAPTRPQIGHE